MRFLWFYPEFFISGLCKPLFASFLWQSGILCVATITSKYFQVSFLTVTFPDNCHILQHQCDINLLHTATELFLLFLLLLYLLDLFAFVLSNCTILFWKKVLMFFNQWVCLHNCRASQKISNWTSQLILVTSKTMKEPL